MCAADRLEKPQDCGPQLTDTKRNVGDLHFSAGLTSRSIRWTFALRCRQARIETRNLGCNERSCEPDPRSRRLQDWRRAPSSHRLRYFPHSAAWRRGPPPAPPCGANALCLGVCLQLRHGLCRSWSRPELARVLLARCQGSLGAMNERLVYGDGEPCTLAGEVSCTG